jgi:hypothetical protein
MQRLNLLTLCARLHAVGVAQPMSTNMLSQPMQVGVRSPWLTVVAVIVECLIWIVIARVGLLVYMGYSQYQAAKAAILSGAMVGVMPWDVALAMIKESLKEYWVWFAAWLVLDTVQTSIEAMIGKSIPKEQGQRFAFTAPVAWLPLGRLTRLLVGLLLCLPVILVKLLVYFLGMTVLLPMALLRGETLGKTLDNFDTAWEPVEHLINTVYNMLHYCKLNPHSSAFSTLFNLLLPMWCLNH